MPEFGLVWGYMWKLSSRSRYPQVSPSVIHFLPYVEKVTHPESCTKSCGHHVGCPSCRSECAVSVTVVLSYRQNLGNLAGFGRFISGQRFHLFAFFRTFTGFYAIKVHKSLKHSITNRFSSHICSNCNNCSYKT